MRLANRSVDKRLSRAPLLFIALLGISATAHAEPPADDVFAVLFAGSGAPNRYEWPYPIESSLAPRMGPQDVIGEGPFAVARYNQAAQLRAAGDAAAFRMRASAEFENHRFLRENVFRQKVPLKLMFPADPELSSLRIVQLPQEIMFKLKDGKLVPTMLNEELTAAVTEFGYAEAFVRAPGDPNSIILRQASVRPNGALMTAGRVLRAAPALASVAYGLLPQQGRNEIIGSAGQPGASAWQQLAGWMVIAGDLSEGPIFGEFFQNRERFQRFFGVGIHKPPTTLERAQAESRRRENAATFEWAMGSRKSAPQEIPAPVARPQRIQLYAVKGNLYDQNGKYAGPAYPGWERDLSRSNDFRPNTGGPAGGAGPAQTKADMGTATQSRTETATASSSITVTATATESNAN
jgi:hypothetical protein